MRWVVPGLSTYGGLNVYTVNSGPLLGGKGPVWKGVSGRRRRRCHRPLRGRSASTKTSLFSYNMVSRRARRPNPPYWSNPKRACRSWTGYPTRLGRDSDPGWRVCVVRSKNENRRRRSRLSSPLTQEEGGWRPRPTPEFTLTPYMRPTSLHPGWKRGARGTVTGGGSPPETTQGERGPVWGTNRENSGEFGSYGLELEAVLYLPKTLPVVHQEQVLFKGVETRGHFCPGRSRSPSTVCSPSPVLLGIRTPPLRPSQSP